MQVVLHWKNKQAKRSKKHPGNQAVISAPLPLLAPSLLFLLVVGRSVLLLKNGFDWVFHVQPNHVLAFWMIKAWAISYIFINLLFVIHFKDFSKWPKTISQTEKKTTIDRFEAEVITISGCFVKLFKNCIIYYTSINSMNDLLLFSVASGWLLFYFLKQFESLPCDLKSAQID